MSWWDQLSYTFNSCHACTAAHHHHHGVIALWKYAAKWVCPSIMMLLLEYGVASSSLSASQTCRYRHLRPCGAVWCCINYSLRVSYVNLFKRTIAMTHVNLCNLQYFGHAFLWPSALWRVYEKSRQCKCTCCIECSFSCTTTMLYLFISIYLLGTLWRWKPSARTITLQDICSLHSGRHSLAMSLSLS